MSKHADKLTLRGVEERLRRLSLRPANFDQRQMAARVEEARVLCDDAFRLYGRRKNKEVEAAVWSEAARLFHQTVDEAYPPGFWDAFAKLKQRDAAAVKLAIRFLEDDPWFFGSGYVKADLLKFLGRMQHSQSDIQRLQEVVLKAIDFRFRREFRWYCKLAKRICSPSFQRAVEQRLDSNDGGVRCRARWTLAAITYNARFFFRQGQQKLSERRYTTALNDFTEAIVREPGFAKAYLWRGKAYSKLGENDRAISDFSRTLEVLPNEHLKSCKYESCRVIPQFVEALIWRACTQYRLRHYEHSIADYARAIDLYPSDQYSHRERARVYCCVKDYNRAIDDLNQAILLNSKDGDAYYLRGLIYSAQNQKKWAVQEFRQALELKPADERFLAALREANLLLEQSEPICDDVASGTSLAMWTAAEPISDPPDGGHSA